MKITYEIDFNDAGTTAVETLIVDDDYEVSKYWEYNTDHDLLETYAEDFYYQLYLDIPDRIPEKIIDDIYWHFDDGDIVNDLGCSIRGIRRDNELQQKQEASAQDY